MFKNIIIKAIIPVERPSKIYYGLVQTREYGELFLAYYLDNNLYRICSLQFVVNGEPVEKFTNELRKYWPQTQCIQDNLLTSEIYAKYLTKHCEPQEVYIALNGTVFQNKVWSALLGIPYGEERTYADIAAIIGNPKASRAVGSAVSANNIAMLVPCHRVRSKTGDTLKYRWGSELKKQILLNEKMNF